MLGVLASGRAPGLDNPQVVTLARSLRERLAPAEGRVPKKGCRRGCRGGCRGGRRPAGGDRRGGARSHTGGNREGRAMRRACDALWERLTELFFVCVCVVDGFGAAREEPTGNPRRTRRWFLFSRRRREDRMGREIDDCFSHDEGKRARRSTGTLGCERGDEGRRARTGGIFFSQHAGARVNVATRVSFFVRGSHCRSPAASPPRARSRARRSSSLRAPRARESVRG